MSRQQLLLFAQFLSWRKAGQEEDSRRTTPWDWGVGAWCRRQWGPSTVCCLLGRDRQADREARWACLSTARNSLAGWHRQTEFIALSSSPAGWFHIRVHVEQCGEGVSPELLILLAEPLPAGQHWGRVVTSNVTQVRRCALAMSLDCP